VLDIIIITIKHKLNKSLIFSCFPLRVGSSFVLLKSIMPSPFMMCNLSFHHILLNNTTHHQVCYEKYRPLKVTQSSFGIFFRINADLLIICVNSNPWLFKIIVYGIMYAYIYYLLTVQFTQTYSDIEFGWFFSVDVIMCYATPVTFCSLSIYVSL